VLCSRPEESFDDELDGISAVVGREKRVRPRELFGTGLRSLLLVGLGLAVFQQFVGVNTVIYFSPTILLSCTRVPRSPRR
jgi:hypothetical protein